jgi:hypothetical protein
MITFMLPWNPLETVSALRSLRHLSRLARKKGMMHKLKKSVKYIAKKSYVTLLAFLVMLILNLQIMSENGQRKIITVIEAGAQGAVDASGPRAVARKSIKVIFAGLRGAHKAAWARKDTGGMGGVS